MRMIPLLLTAGLAMPIHVHDTPQDRTIIVEGEHGTSVITQSGDPVGAELRIERSPGRTTIYSRSGGNSSIVTQSNNPADFPYDAWPPELKDLFGRR
ncbi:hypothetical protein ACRAWG_15270 [Methylobacterium sp. P31]